MLTTIRFTSCVHFVTAPSEKKSDKPTRLKLDCKNFFCKSAGTKQIAGRSHFFQKLVSLECESSHGESSYFPFIFACVLLKQLNPSAPSVTAGMVLRQVMRRALSRKEKASFRKEILNEAREVSVQWYWILNEHFFPPLSNNLCRYMHIKVKLRLLLGDWSHKFLLLCSEVSLQKVEKKFNTFSRHRRLLCYMPSKLNHCAAPQNSFK